VIATAWFLAALIVAAPLFALVDSPVIQGVVVVVAAVALAATARVDAGGQAEHPRKSARRVVWCLVIPAIWMMIQTAPMSLHILAHPIWASAELALGSSVTGGIGVDRGAALIALTRYLGLVAIVLAAMTVAADRQRAERMLLVLTGATTAMAILLLASPLTAGLQVFAMFAMEEGSSLGIRSGLIGGSSLGVIAGIAMAQRGLERYQGRRPNVSLSRARPALFVAAGLGAVAICWFALQAIATPAQCFVAACGLVMMVLVAIAKRLRLGSAASAAIAAVAIIVAVTLATSRPNADGDLTLRFADVATPQRAITERMLADAGWAGSGPGGLAALTPVYRAADELALVPVARTSAAEIAVDLGVPALWVIVIMALAATWFLLEGAMRRGRDSFYPSAGASTILVLTLQSFVDASLLGTVVPLLAAAILGIGMAQSVGRGAQGAMARSEIRRPALAAS